MPERETVHRDREGTVPASTSLDPWREKGLPLEQQYRSWRQVVRTPFDKRDVDAYTRTRVILMNGIENEALIYSHGFARAAGDQAIRYDVNPTPHANLVCTRCRRITDLTTCSDAIALLSQHARVDARFQPEWERIEIFGLCPECQSLPSA